MSNLNLRLNKAKKSYCILKNNCENQYKLYSNMHNKIINISVFLVHKISINTNSYKFNIRNLMNRFHCSRKTVYNAIKVLKSCKDIKIKGHVISFIHFKGLKKEGDLSD